MEIISGVLGLAGLVCSFFFLRFGGLLLGLGVGMSLHPAIGLFFAEFSRFYARQGAFRVGMLAALVIYTLLAMPSCVVSLAIGCGIAHLFQDKQR